MADDMTLRWWHWIPLQPWRLLGYVESADEVPDRLPRGGMVAVGSSDRVKWVAFDCPCRSGHRILVNADPGRRPQWRVDADQPRRMTLHPSIDYADARRRCHYFIRDGRVLWAGDS